VAFRAARALSPVFTPADAAVCTFWATVCASAASAMVSFWVTVSSGSMHVARPRVRRFQNIV
jgi:hypothetical protein